MLFKIASVLHLFLVVFIWKVKCQHDGKCGDVFRSSSGVVQSFPYPGPYFPNQDCVWKLQPFSPGETGLIELTFLDFELEGGPSCSRYDFLRLNYTSPTRGNRWYCYWGQHPTPFTTTLVGNVVLQFKSDQYQSYRGFTAKFQTYKNIDHICTFDENLCGWVNAPGDHMDWTWFTGSTPSENTGPRKDHTSQLGYYLYVEASEQHYEGEKAWLVSPVFKSRRSNCLWFHYHMLGLHVGSLNVYVNKKLVWKLSGSYGSSWHKAQIPLPARRGKTFRIMFEAVGGYSYEGDIAIDDIVLLKHSSCQHIPWIAAPTTQPPTSLPSVTATIETELTTETLTTTAETDMSETSTSLSTPPEPDCGGELTNRLGVFSSYPFPGPYDPNLNCVWKINPFTDNEKGIIRISLIQFQLQDSKHCNKDYLKILHQVPSYEKPRSLCYRGQQWTPLSVILRGNVTVEFHSDNVTSNNKGFTATYQAFTGVDHICTFDENLCGWSNIPGDRSDWSWYRGKTPTRNTGPSFDHTSSLGYYMYIESSDYTKAGVEAWLESPLFSPGQANCLTFYYHMFGSDIGTLKVFVQQRMIWSMRGPRNDIWHKGEVPLPKMKAKYRIKFEGIRGNGYEGDIAIDDVMLWKASSCQYRPWRARPTADPSATTTMQIETTLKSSEPPQTDTEPIVMAKLRETRSLTSEYSSKIVISVSTILAILLLVVLIVFVWYCWFSSKRRRPEHVEVTMYPHISMHDEYKPKIEEEHQYMEISNPKGFQ